MQNTLPLSSFEPVCGTQYASSCRGKCNGTICVCPPGWTNNKMTFFVQDCSEPIGLFEATCAVAILYSLIGLTWGTYNAILHATGTVRELVIWFLVANFSLLIGNIATLAIGYVGLPFWIFAMPLVFCMGVGYSKFIYAFFNISAKSIGSQGTDVILSHHALFNAMFVMLAFLIFLPQGIVNFVVQIYLGDERNPGYNAFVHNSCMFWTYLLFPIHTLVAGPLGLWIVNGLLQAIDDVEKATIGVREDVDRFATIKKRLRMFRGMNTVSFIIFEWIFTGVGYAMVYSIHSPALPFMSCMVLVGTPFCVSVQCYILMAKSSSLQSSSNHTNSKLQIATTDNGRVTPQSPDASVSYNNKELSEEKSMNA